VNKPTLSPNLSVLEQVEQSGMKRLLVIGVGCQIQALRAVENNWVRKALRFRDARRQRYPRKNSWRQPAVLQKRWCITVHARLQVHFKHEDGSVETNSLD